MSTIKKVEYERKKSHLRYDGTKKRWIGYQIDVRINKKRHRNTFPTKGEAERFLDELRKQTQYRNAGLKLESNAVPLIGAVFAKRLEAITNKSEKVRAKRVFNYFLDLQDFPIKITDLRSAHYREFINARTADGMKPESVNREINILSSAFHRAAEMFPLELDDFEPPKAIRPRFKQRRRERVITEGENIDVLNRLYREREETESDRVYANRVRVGRMWQLAWLLGLRYSEVTGLLKTDYKREARTLRVVRWKTGNVTLFDFLPDEAIELLDAAVDASETEFILSLTGSTPTQFYKILKDAVEHAGLTWGRDGVDSVTFHSLRHSFITRTVQTTDLATAAYYSGHTTGSEMIALYSHSSPESRKKAMTSMYGKIDEKKLREIYDKVASGKLEFEAFLAALK